MARRIILAIMLVTLATGQQKRKPAVAHKPSANDIQRELIYLRLNVLSVKFETSCARTADRTDNKRCVGQMLHELQANFNQLHWTDIPSPSQMEKTEIIWLFKEETLIDETTLTLTVYETENNTEIYSKPRKVLFLDHDILKLVQDYVKSVIERQECLASGTCKQEPPK